LKFELIILIFQEIKRGIFLNGSVRCHLLSPPLCSGDCHFTWNVVDCIFHDIKISWSSGREGAEEDVTSMRPQALAILTVWPEMKKDLGNVLLLDADSLGQLCTVRY